MNFDDLMKHYGGAVAAARDLKVARGTVYRWKEEGIPDMRQYYIEAKTGGALKADQVGQRA